ncbi:CBU_0592 family membrane protein [Aestuariibaculum marinum]|uniref:CBU-0592-like domain-containing protein n=1 Tax=Aestuariibaculum marinum TaxID=2683592 RepID=A0A8J6U9Y8_9FLAO|nr:hypothetical protein [Aestuariibaculum marinum]MBD0822673.1 hypothetical protein [Aestuariibaculum marinum]
MNLTDWIGFVGVSLILLAYILNVTNKISNTHVAFILLNFIGASSACLASILLNYWPFIILEGVWALVSLLTLFRYRKLK